MPKGIKIWNKAKKIIPGGNGLLSKRPDRYLPGLWPTYFKKAKGINIWDLENKRYIDMAQMGMGSSILGYCNKFVDDRVKKAIKDGTTPRHVPREVISVKDIPYTRSGKKMEMAVGRVISGKELQNIEAIANPECLDDFKIS